jgi:hypothetical protein
MEWCSGSDESSGIDMLEDEVGLEANCSVATSGATGLRSDFKDIILMDIERGCLKANKSMALGSYYNYGA